MEVFCVEQITLFDSCGILLSEGVKRLAEFEEFLPEHLFVRIHRSHIVSLRAVTKFVGNTVWLGDLSLPIGEKYRDGFPSRLDIL